MTQDPSKQLVENLARRTVEQVAPEELSKFQVVSKEYFEDQGAVVASAKQQEQELGFGIGVVEAIATPIVLWLANKILELAWETIKEPIQNELTDPVRRCFKYLFKKLRFTKRTKPTVLPVLTPSQRQRVRKDALTAVKDLAQAYKLSQTQTTKIVDAIIEQLPNRKPK